MATALSLLLAPSSESLINSYERSLRAANHRVPTIASYVTAAKQFCAFCHQEGLPELEHVSREHVELWLDHLHATMRPYTVRLRYVTLHLFFRWLLEEGEIERDPMARIKMPRVDEVQKDVVAPADLQAVFAHMAKTGRVKNVSPFIRSLAERDALIIAMLYDCGLRVGELAALKTDAVDLNTGVIHIDATTTKGRRARAVRLSPAGLAFLDRYLRHRAEKSEYLLTGTRGPMTATGIYVAVTRRFAAVGVKAVIGPHDLRHTSATHLSGKLSESEMMTLYGWKDADMARHYTRLALEKNALAAHVRNSPLQNLLKKR